MKIQTAKSQVTKYLRYHLSMTQAGTMTVVVIVVT